MSIINQYRETITAFDKMVTTLDELRESLTKAEHAYIVNLDPNMKTWDRLPTDPQAIAFLLKASELFYGLRPMYQSAAKEIQNIYSSTIRWGSMPSMSIEPYNYGECGVAFTDDGDVEISLTGHVDQCGDTPSCDVVLPAALVTGEITVEQLVEQRAIKVFKAIKDSAKKVKEALAAADKAQQERDEEQLAALAAKLGKTVV